MRKILLIAFWLMSPSVFSATEDSASSTIELLHSYPNRNGGEVMFKLGSVASEVTCKGYWLKTDSTSSAATFSMILAAYQAKTKIKVWGHIEEVNKWSGTTAHFCKVYTVAYGY